MRYPRAGRRAVLLAAAAAVSLLLTACQGSAPTKVSMPRSIGKGEGQLNLITWEGYAESGSSDPKVDWVTPFEKKTGCEVSTTYVETAEDMVELMRDNADYYDGVSAPGRVAGTLIAEDLVAPINVELIDGYGNLVPALQDAPQVTAGGKRYGLPFLWELNTLTYNAEEVSPPPSSWAAIFNPERAARYGQRLTLPDNPMTIAGAALYLQAHRPQLGITDPYTLTPRQLEAAVALLQRQRPSVKEYWSSYAEPLALYKSGGVVIGQARTHQAQLLRADGQPIKSVLPAEGTTATSDSWMVSAQAPHPNRMYRWMNWTNSPKVQAEAAQWVGAAPANTETCQYLAEGFCARHHVRDEEYLNKVYFHRTPCARGERNCTDYETWSKRWTDVVE